MTERMLVLVAALLAGLTLYQVSWHSIEEGSDAFVSGTELPDSLSFSTETCWMGYFVDPACSFCGELLDQVHSREHIRWVFGGDAVEIDSVIEHYSLAAGRVRIAATGADGIHPFRTYGVPGVPARVIAAGSELVDVALAGDPITRDSVEAVCRSAQGD